MPGSTKHACPGVHHPMAEADGLLARIRVPGGRLSVAQWAGAARAAARHGSGTIELTRRANLQLRGIRAAAVEPLVGDLVALGLVHPEPGADERRNVVGAPATGLDRTEVTDVSELVAELDRRLAAQRRRLHPKAVVVVDAGGAVSLRGRRADVALGAVRRRDTGAVAYEVAVGDALPTLDVGPIALVAPADAAVWAVTALADAAPGRPAGPPAGLEPVDATLVERAAPDLDPPLGRWPWGVGAAPPLGRIDAVAATAVADALAARGARELRLTPWRGIVVGLADDRHLDGLLTDLGGLGLVVDRADPAADVVACAGRTGCASGSADTIADAELAIARLRARPPAGRFTLHLSGCDKRCASHAPSDLTLVATDDGRGYAGLDRTETEVVRSVAVTDALDAVGR